ncbi:alpha/beta hydrolase [Agrococcus sediminis]|uniref:alpha/beta hydrolase n=1 Tax=Agrococcus sediminis TaxID=2599924 RepID=UPI00381E2878
MTTGPGLTRLWRALRRALPSRGVPVWAWRAMMRAVAGRELRTFNADPIADVRYDLDIDYVGDGDAAHRLDVLSPAWHADRAGAGAAPLPVYVYFHGGGWTSGDKAALTKYCASQSVGGMVVVNANYRRATRAHMGHILQDAAAVMAWVTEHIASYGGDPESVVLGGDSAGGQIAALLTAASFHPELQHHHALASVPDRRIVKGLVQHCSVVDFSVVFERGSALSLDFIRMLVPRHRHVRGATASAAMRWLRGEARFLSPIEWLAPEFPPVLVTTSERDYFYRANMNFLRRLRAHRIPVEALVYDRSARRAVHTWQQNAAHAESQEVYRRLHRFVQRVTGAAPEGLRA